MKVLKVCLLATLLAVGASAAPKTQAQRNHERAQLRAAQREAAANRGDAKDRQREREYQRDSRATAKRNAHGNSTGEDIVRNTEEAGDNITNTGKEIRDWFGF